MQLVKFKITVIKVKDTIKINGNKMQFQQKSILKENWWLMWCSFPNLNWARLRTYDDLSAEILDCDGSKYTFSNEEEARYSLMEDEYNTHNLNHLMKKMNKNSVCRCVS